MLPFYSSLLLYACQWHMSSLFLIIFGDVICIMLNFEELSHKLFSLVIFRNLLNDDVIKSFTELADEQKSEKEEVYLYADFLSKLFAETDNFSKICFKRRFFEDENAYILKVRSQKARQPL